MGWFGDLISKARDGLSSVASSIKEKVLNPIFGSQTGALKDFTNTVASKVTGGADNFGDALINATVKGGALDALNFTKGKALDTIMDATHKVGASVGRIPVIGQTLAQEVNNLGNAAANVVGGIPTSKGALEAALSPNTASQPSSTQ